MTPEEIAAAAAAAEAAAAEAAAAEAAATSAAEETARLEAEKAAKAKAKKPAGSEESAKAAAEAADRAERAEAALAALQDKFKGIDPAKAKEALSSVEKAKQEARDAEKAKAEAEGNWARVRELANEEHATALAAERKAGEEATNRATEAEARANRLLIANTFNGSDFIREKVVLSPDKTYRVYADYVEIDGDSIIVFNKPKGDAGRHKLLDSKGAPMAFDAAIQKVIESEPDKDRLLRATVKPGANSKVTVTGKDEGVTGQGRLDKFKRGLSTLR